MTTNFYYANQNQLIYGNETRNNQQDIIDVKTRHTFYSIDLAYKFTNQLTVDARLPYIDNERTEGVNTDLYSARGFGDFMLKGSYYIWEPALDNLNVLGEVGLQFPTGQSDLTYFKRKAKVKNWDKPYIQPGSGTWNPLIGLGADYETGNWTFYLTSEYLFTPGENDAGYDAGEPWNTTLGLKYLAYRFGDAKDAPFIGVEGSGTLLWVNGRESRWDVKVGNTGGTWINAEPGIFFSPDGGRFTLEVTVPFPVYWHVNELQCKENWALNINLGYRF